MTKDTRMTWRRLLAVPVTALVTVLVIALAGCSFPAPAPSPGPSVAPAPEFVDPSPPVVEESERAPTPAAVITIHPEATAAALDALSEGGSAADAAFAAAAVLSVVEPHYSNLIGGETSALYFNSTAEDIQALEAVGPVGSRFDIDRYRSQGPASYGLHQALVPGAWDGWMVLLEAEGRMDLDRLLEPAIALARDGHEVTDLTASQLRDALGRGAVNDAAQAVYVPGGTPVAAGSTLVQADFAKTLQGIADAYAAEPERDGGIVAAREHVYSGKLGKRLLSAAREGGATFTAKDLAGYSAEFKEPLSIDYRGHTIYQSPPTTQGLTMLIALNILRNAKLSPKVADSAGTAHTLIEAMKLAMADREAYIGDPAFTDVPIRDLLDPDYGERQFARIDPERSHQWPIEPGLEDNTTTFQIVDHDGNAIAVTTSTGYQFVAAGDTGIMMNNRMRFMTAGDPSSPNFLEPGKRVRYTGNPYIVTDGSGVRLLGGNIGADTQSQAQTQQVVAVLDFGLSAKKAIARHRFVAYATPGSIVPHGANNNVAIEDTTPQRIITGLQRRGQNIYLTSGPSGAFGYGTMIEVRDGGAKFSLGTDPRFPTSTGKVRKPSGE
ncbi:gamma-glutamyltransferase family protein [Leucobacter soli]|uniref:Glutathione hydrolase-like YwrD proenzyme n=1 Tax=Leucobacter soli TaxID=2812850 RepID=A0A916K092_9MICO|nr:gamma-glutamyltransferase [Leucobacter soli]CAG7621235.1 Glutathione hydrolase-like YwrD proenzyme [Leucobacter soli]